MDRLMRVVSRTANAGSNIASPVCTQRSLEAMMTTAGIRSKTRMHSERRLLQSVFARGCAAPTSASSREGGAV